MPASPTMPTTCPRPLAASARRLCSKSSSWRRPTNCARRPPRPRPVRSSPISTWARALSGGPGLGVSSKRRMSSEAAVSVTRMLPSDARSTSSSSIGQTSRRSSMSSSAEPGPGPTPTSTTPTWMPTLTAVSAPSSRWARSTALRIAMALWPARSAASPISRQAEDRHGTDRTEAFDPTPERPDLVEDELQRAPRLELRIRPTGRHERGPQQGDAPPLPAPRTGGRRRR